MNSLGLYFSVPFCRSKCTYCNFASGVFPLSLMGGYVEHLRQDLAEARGRAEQQGLVLPEAVDSIYFGGGTPSLLEPAMIRALFTSIQEDFRVVAGAEITLECAPGQVEPVTQDAMLACGVNRISFGVQSFIDLEAKASGRLHTRALALEDIDRMQRAGLRVNVDLIAGLPHQTAASWTESLRVLSECGVDHASVYMLEIDDESRLGREVLSLGQRYSAGKLPSEDEAADFYIEAVETLASLGLAQYEISNFARAGNESVHNLKYWQRKPYLGLGVDAHSMLRTTTGAAARFSFDDDLQQYLAGRRWPEADLLPPDAELEEALFLGLRMNAGVDLAELAREFGECALARYALPFRELEEEGLLARTGQRICLTARGRLLSNDVFARFLLEEQESVAG
ncbi:radical SAM family heme chaperone HemW [Acidipila rosea]|uniref:Heme chaperone HemW n=1 Tax=Acidipila rosea TaxID=768535 RepID=A0A4R1L651_9BACT|nr:radical SAM family heme chaperone HemW [Acidipila rosea]TCK73636.1 oxygen-independent coproporphyrinogen-3 oxidase [Acidipila rosea]